MEMDRKCLYSTEENCAGQISKEKKKEIKASYIISMYTSILSELFHFGCII